MTDRARSQRNQILVCGTTERELSKYVSLAAIGARGGGAVPAMPLSFLVGADK